jgi:hypothetical protein
MGTIHDAIRREAKELGVRLTIAKTARIVGTLRTADVSEVSPIFSNIVKQELARLNTTESGTEDSFMQIDTSMQQGYCPKCGQATKEVKLYDYSPANYCEACRVSLWTIEKK